MQRAGGMLSDSDLEGSGLQPDVGYPRGSASGLRRQTVGDSQYGKDKIEQFWSSPLTGFLAPEALANSAVANRARGYFSLEPFKYYYNVSNDYVLNKLKLLLYPFAQQVQCRFDGVAQALYTCMTHECNVCFALQQWARRVGEDMSGTLMPLPPREDVFAPDLYIPSMAVVTYILVVGLVEGTANQCATQHTAVLLSPTCFV
jgi:YIF1 protein